MKKMTKKEAFTILLTMAEVRENEEILEILEREIANLEKRAAAPRKPSKIQTENAALAERIAELLEPERVYTSSEIISLLSEKEGVEYSIQKISRILPIVSGIEKIEDKRKVFWTLKK